MGEFFFYKTHCPKNEICHCKFLHLIWLNPQETVDLVTFTEEIIKANLNFLQWPCWCLILNIRQNINILHSSLQHLRCMMSLKLSHPLRKHNDNLVSLHQNVSFGFTNEPSVWHKQKFLHYFYYHLQVQGFQFSFYKYDKNTIYTQTLTK